MNEHIVRITNHPHGDAVVLVHAGPDLADHMGSYPPARWSPDDKAYLLATDAIAGLETMARHYGITVVDQRTPADDGPRPVPQECRRCATPGRFARPPAYCPGCGQAWDPVPPPALNLAQARPACPDCGKRQRGRFDYCWSCGAPMPAHPITQFALHESRNDDRPHLDEPLPLGDSIDHVLGALT